MMWAAQIERHNDGWRKSCSSRMLTGVLDKETEPIANVFSAVILVSDNFLNFLKFLKKRALLTEFFLRARCQITPQAASVGLLSLRSP